MAQTIKLKRSNTSGAVPTTSQLELGEVAINTYDGKMYIKKNDGSDSVVEIGGGSSGNADTVDNLHASQFVRSDADDEKTGHLKLRNNAWLWTQYSSAHDEVRINANTSGGLDVYNQTDSAFANIQAGSFQISGTGTITGTTFNNWNTAYGWGNHASAGYITGNQTITLTGDVSGSGTTSINVTVADDSHNHIISNVDGLQTALDEKQPASTALTTSTNFSGDVSGTYNNIVVANDSHNHNHSDGDFTVNGGLVVEGSKDSNGSDYGFYQSAGTNIILKGDSSGRSGIFFQSEKNGTNINHSSDYGFIQFHAYGYGGSSGESIDMVIGTANDSSDHVILQSPYNGGVKVGYKDATSGTGLTTQTIFHDAYHPNADKWTTARTLSLTGDVTGSVSWDGSANASLTTTIADDSHNHVISNVDGLQSALDAKLASSSYTASDVLTKIKTVDGSGSGLDADTVDGVQASSFLRSDSADTSTGLTTFNGGISVLSGTGGGKLRIKRNSGSTDGDDITDIHMDDGGIFIDIDNDNDGDSGNFLVRYKTGGSFSNLLFASPSALTYKNQGIWHSGNDGSGSGLDADNLDGRTWSTTPNSANTLVTRDANGYTQLGWINTTSGSTTSTINRIYASYDNYIRYVTPDTLKSQLGLWHSGNDGAGSGLDADLLDGQHGSYYAPASHNHNGVYTPYDHFRHTGHGNYTSTTTSALLTEALGDDAFDSKLTAHKTSWSYAGNGDLTDAGRLTELAGTSWLWWTDNSTDNVQGNITALAIAPNTGGSAGKMFVYNNQGSSYAPGWREIWTSTSDGSGSGLDADTVDGQHASAFQPAGTYNTVIGTDSDINTSGSTIIDNIYVTDGVITSMGTRSLTLSDLGYSGGIGDGQTWQDVLSSRSVNTTYQNTTGKPIVVSIYGEGDDGTTSFAPNSSTAVFQVSTNGSTWVNVMDSFLERTGNSSSYRRIIHTNVVVPNNHYYRIDVQYSWYSTFRWAELR